MFEVPTQAFFVCNRRAGQQHGPLTHFVNPILVDKYRQVMRLRLMFVVRQSLMDF